MSMLNETLHHASGHRFEPNGVGDYDLVCPKHGKQPGFVPFMLARVAGARSVCNACGLPIGERTEP